MQSGNYINGKSIFSDSNKRVTIIDNVEYEWVSGMSGRNMSQVNGDTFIDGYQLVNGKWKRTARAFYHLFF